MSSGGQIAGGVVGAVLGYVLTGTPQGAFYSATITSSSGCLIRADANTDADPVELDPVAGETHEHP